MARSPLAAMLAQSIAPPAGAPPGTALPPAKGGLPPLAAPAGAPPAAGPPVKMRMPAKRAPRPPAPGGKPQFGGKKAPPFMSQRKPPLGT